MKNKILIVTVLSIFLISGCAPTYKGPYASTSLVTKDTVKKQIDSDNKLISNSKTPLIKQVKAKADVKYFKMLLACYINYETLIKNTDGKKFTITATDINKFIKIKKYESDLKLVEPDKQRWPAIFLGNLARYFNSIGFSVYTDPAIKQENIILTW